MKYCRIICFVLTLFVITSLCPCVFAEESAELSEESASVGGGGFAISYGYKPLQAPNGVNAANYVKGPTPPTEYVSAGGSHTVAENDYTFRDYVFVGWSCNGKLYKPGEVIYNVQSSMSLIATWGRCAVDGITVFGVLSYADDEAINVAVGSTVDLKSGTWQTEDGKIIKGENRFLMSFTNVSLKSYSAEAESYKISYNGNGANDGVQCDFRVEAGSSFTVDNCFGNRDGYSFIGWEDSQGRIYLAGDTCTVNGDTVLTAKWQESSKPAPDYCSVSLSSGEGGSISPAGKTTVLKGDVLEFAVAAEKGYELSSVICDGEELGTGGTYKKTVNADMIIKASFVFVGVEDSSEVPVVSAPEETSEDGQQTEEEISDIIESAEESESKAPSDVKSNDDGKGKTYVLLLCILFIVAGGWFVAISIMNKSKKKKRKKRK